MTHRRSHVAAALACAAALTVLAVPSVAAARGGTCPSTATVQSITGSGQLLDFYRSAPAGAPLAGRTLHQTTNPLHGHYYELQGVSAKLRYGLNTYTLSPGTTFYLQCYGQARGSTTLYPALAMLDGTATVHVSASHPGAVLTWEGLYGPIPGATISRGYTFRVTRSTTKPVDPEGVANWFGGFIEQPVGQTTVKVVGRALVNVTPYVGPRRGSCRHVRGAVLVSTGNRRIGHDEFIQVGTSRYS